MNETLCESPETRFIGLMSELFQLREAEELDFGIYRIIRRHNRKVREFLGEVVEENGQPVLRGGELAGILEGAFQHIGQETRNEKKLELQRMAEALGIKAHLSADEREQYLLGVEKIPAMRQQVMDYRNLREELETTYSASADRSEVLNRLYEFFSRHYQDGDFIVQRRYGRNGARYIRSSGEDTEFHWATEDMYYIKSGDVFTDYPVCLSNGPRLVFCVDAETLKQTRAELKPTDKASYKLRAIVQDSPRPLAGEGPGERVLDSPRPLGEGPGVRVRVILDYVKGAQKARAQLEEIASKTASVARVQPEEIARHLRRYVARNQSDFFIHKRLREALDDDLDIFVKTDVLNAEQLLVDEAGQLPARALRVARVIRTVGRRINAFLGVLEDFQKRLWEKKKLVLSTRYVITLDRLDKLAGREFVEAKLAVILANAAQTAEWRALGLGERTTAEAVRHEDGGFLPLPVDTLHFDEDFKWALLAVVTKDHPLDESLDGVAIHSDNWQALNTMQEKYWERVKCVYIDPPYNTGGDGFPYKDSYQSASWLALMEDRLHLGAKTLRSDGAFFSSIDQKEYPKLRILLEATFGHGNALGTIVWKNVTDNNPTNIAVEHEYIESFAKNRVLLESEWKSPYSDAKDLLIKVGRELIERYHDTLELQRAYQEWFKGNKEFLGPLEGYKFIDGDGIYAGSRSVHNPGKEGYRYDIIHPQTKKPCRQPLMGYRFPEETYKRLYEEGRIIFGDDETKLIELKVYAHEYQVKLPSVIELDGRSGANHLTNLFNVAQQFKNPKSPALLQQLIPYAAGTGDVVADFFLGSGTTVHALMRLNRRSGLALRWLGIEAGYNFEMLVVPRVKKAAYSVEWLKGQPVSHDGPGAFIRVQRLEQYEDTLENLAVAAGETPSLFAGPEALAYKLDAEAKRLLFASSSFTAPFGLTLKLIAGADVETGPVDLVESLIYLLGLHVERLYREQGSVILTGALNRSRQTAAVFWRDNVLHGADWLQAKMAEHPADRYYTNDPARLSFPGVERFAAIETVFVEGMA